MGLLYDYLHYFYEQVAPTGLNLVDALISMKGHPDAVYYNYLLCFYKQIAPTGLNLVDALISLNRSPRWGLF
jgi:hypothetical protein